MRVFLCEKPSQGKDIARVLGASQRGNGCYSGSGTVVTWCIGHLIEAAPPEAYGEQFKRWSIDQLPILPERWRVEVKPKTAAQFKTVQQLLAKASELVIATDADRERAIDSLKDFITVFPDSEKVPEATHRLALCRHAMFRSLLDQAVSWENRSKPAAAAICYQILGTRYADLASSNPELAARIAAATPPTPPSKPPAAPATPSRPRTPANPLDPVLR